MLDGVAVEIDPSVAQEPRQAIPASKRIADRLAEFAFGADLTEASLEILMELFDDWSAALVADGAALLGREPAHLILDGVEQRDPAQDFGRHRRSIGELVELAPHMCPAEGEPDLLPAAGERAVTAKAACLQNAAEAFEMRDRSLRLAIGRIDVGDERRIAPAPGAIIAGICP